MRSNGNFIHDYEKMVDFKNLSKDEFMRSYSYLTDDEYENTKRIYNKRCTDEYCPECDDAVVIFAEMKIQRWLSILKARLQSTTLTNE